MTEVGVAVRRDPQRSDNPPVVVIEHDGPFPDLELTVDEAITLRALLRPAIDEAVGAPAG